MLNIYVDKYTNDYYKRSILKKYHCKMIFTHCIMEYVYIPALITTTNIICCSFEAYYEDRDIGRIPTGMDTENEIEVYYSRPLLKYTKNIS